MQKVLILEFILQNFENEFISLTDIARYKSDDPTSGYSKLDEKSGCNRIFGIMGKAA